MAAGLGALRDHRVAPVIGQPASLVDGRGAGQHPGAGGPHAGHQIRIREPEMKADDLGVQLLDQLAPRCVERFEVDHRARGIGVEPVLGVVTAQPTPPPVARYGNDVRACMAEEVDVHRARCGRPDHRELSAYLVDVAQRTGQRTQPTCPTDCDRQRRAVGAGHRRLDDRHVNTQQLQQPRLRPIRHRHSHILAAPQGEPLPPRRGPLPAALVAVSPLRGLSPWRGS